MDLGQMMIKFASDFNVAMWKLLWSLGMLVGLLYVGSALLKMQRASRFPGQNPVSFGDILPVIVVGALMWNLSTFLNTTWNTFGVGATTFGPLSYSGAAAIGGKFEPMINAALTLVSIFGGVFFFKGVLLLKKASSGQASQGDDFVWKALTHMLGGAALVNIPKVLEAAQTSFGIMW